MTWVLWMAILAITFMQVDMDYATAESKKSHLSFSNGAFYYGEVKKGKPHGKGTMTYNKSKSYQGNWYEGKRSGYGTYKSVTSKDQVITTTRYTGNWKNDKKDGIGELLVSQIEFDETILENSIQKGTFNQDRWVSGYAVRRGEYDPSHNYLYKDDKLSIEIMSDELDMDQIDSGSFFSFTYKKGNLYKNFAAGEEFSEQNYKAFLKKVRAEIKPHIEQFAKLAKIL